MKQAMIFAAGLGTRLKPITDTKPKALVEVAGKPLLRHVIEKLKANGFERIVINIHHFGEQITNYLSANNNFGVNISISDERKQLLETGGGIKKAQTLFDSTSPILIHNVDILSNANLSSLYDKATTDATLLVSNRNSNRRLLFDNNMSLKGWMNVETGETRPQHINQEVSNYQQYAFSGIHVFSPNMFGAMNNYPERFKIIDFYLDQCTKHNITGVVDNRLKLMDVGKINTLDLAEKWLEENTDKENK